MNHHFIQKLKEIENTYEELGEKIADPQVMEDQESYRRLLKTHHQLSTTVETYRAWKGIEAQITDTQELLRAEDDREMRELAEQELERLRKQNSKLMSDLKIMLLPSDPNDDKDIMVEIRAGTGGDEASLFAGDLLRMYLRYA